MPEPALDSPPQQSRGPATWFAGGFRPFFLGAGLAALGPMLWWLLHLGDWTTTPDGWIPMWWHAHEMLFGFTGAAIAGFLLTAVPKWTGTKPVTGPKLGLVFACWVAGRVAMGTAGVLPPILVAVADLSLVPAVALAVAPPILATQNARNYPFVALLTALFLSNLGMHLQILREIDISPRTSLTLGIHCVVLMLVILAGRLIPNFTRNALRRRGDATEVLSAPGIEPVVFIAAVATAAAAVASTSPWLQSLTAAITCAALIVRASRWRLSHCLDTPILWSLHAGHAWLIIAYLVTALVGVLPEVTFAMGLHAFTAGAMGTMILAVMTRAALGHSGRPLKVHPVIAVAYVLVIVGGLARVLLPLTAMDPSTISASAGALWGAGFATFVAIYAPILALPRIDGRPG